MLNIELPTKKQALISEDGFVRLSMDKSFLKDGDDFAAKSVHTFLAGVLTLKDGQPVENLAQKVDDKGSLLLNITKLASTRILDTRQY